MAKHMLGIYETQDEALRAIDVYQLEGHEKKNILILTNSEDIQELKNHSQIQVKPDIPNGQDEGIAEVIKDRITMTLNLDLDSIEKLVAYGLSEVDAQGALKAVDNGLIAVVVDDERRMGHMVDAENRSAH